MNSTAISDGSSGFESRNCVDVLIVINEGDMVSGPCPPALLKQAMAEREKIAKWKHLLDQIPPQNPPNASSQK